MATLFTPSSSGIATESLDDVSFVNPNAVQARSLRRNKLAAARARAAAMSCSTHGTAVGGGEKEVRKQQRMLRNRESAALSRKRKSDRIEELESQVDFLQGENRRLRDLMAKDGAPAAGLKKAGANIRALPAASVRHVRSARPRPPPSSLPLPVKTASSTTAHPVSSPTSLSNSPDTNSCFVQDVAGCYRVSSTSDSGSISCSSSSSSAAAGFNFSRPAVFA